MKKKKGDLPGRYVLPHIRKWPNHPERYVNVAAYQEKVDPVPSPLITVPPQGELEFPAASEEEHKKEEKEG
jgi:hypothetical protein